MSTIASITRTRTARAAVIAVAASITAVTTTVAATPSAGPAPERPCFIVQPRWNTALDNPAPSCSRPVESGDRFMQYVERPPVERPPVEPERIRVEHGPARISP